MAAGPPMGHMGIWTLDRKPCVPKRISKLSGKGVRMKRTLAFFISAALFITTMIMFPAGALAQAPSARYAQLQGIGADAGVWNRDFLPSRYSYVLRLAENEGSVTITPVKSCPEQTVKIDGADLESITVSLDNAQRRHIKIRVAEAGKRSRTYSVKVVRAASTNNDLSSLTVTAGASDPELAPEFDPSVTEYEVSLGYYQPCATVKAEKADKRSTLRIDGRKTAARKYWVKAGEQTTVKITVRSQAKTIKTYLVRITREACPIEDRAQALIDFAKHYIGCPYVRGAKGPDCFDCSGFVYYCLKGVGEKLTYMTSRVWPKSKYEKIAALSEMIPGDILCFNGHVGIYMGGGMMIDSGSSADGVSVRGCTSPYWTQNFICGKRVIPAAETQ